MDSIEQELHKFDQQVAVTSQPGTYSEEAGNQPIVHIAEPQNTYEQLAVEYEQPGRQGTYAALQQPPAVYVNMQQPLSD